MEKEDASLFNFLFNDIDFSWCTSSSFRLKRFIESYAIQELKINKSYNGTGDKSYEFAKVFLPNNEARYYFLANCIYIDAISLHLDNAIKIFEDFKSTYPESKYTRQLDALIRNKTNLSVGNTAPNFTIPDWQGNKVSLSNFDNKWVFLFIKSSELEPSLEREINAVEKIREKIGKDKFEAIWVMTGKDKEKTNELIKKCKSLGTVLLCPGHEDKDFSKYKDTYFPEFQWHLLSPGRKIEGNIRMNLELDFLNQLIKTIEQYPFKSKTSSINLKALIWAFSIITGLLVLAFIIYRRRMSALHKKEAKLKEKLDLELKAIRSQLNPHFMFNSLSSIQHLVSESRIEDANRYLSYFSVLMRKVLQQADKELIPLGEELDTVKQYLELEAFRFKFKFNIETDESIDLFNVEIPPLILQPFVENSVLHGINQLKEKGYIRIKVTKSINQIKIIIEDNGVGINDLKNGKIHSNGKGIELTQKRMNIVKQNFANELKFSVIDLKTENSQGTRVEITFDLEK